MGGRPSQACSPPAQPRAGRPAGDAAAAPGLGGAMAPLGQTRGALRGSIAPRPDRTGLRSFPWAPGARLRARLRSPRSAPAPAPPAPSRPSQPRLSAPPPHSGDRAGGGQPPREGALPAHAEPRSRRGGGAGTRLSPERSALAAARTGPKRLIRSERRQPTGWRCVTQSVHHGGGGARRWRVLTATPGRWEVLGSGPGRRAWQRGSRGDLWPPSGGCARAGWRTARLRARGGTCGHVAPCECCLFSVAAGSVCAHVVCLRLCLRLWLSLLSVRPWARDACARALPARRVCASAGSRWPGSGGHEWARVWLFPPPTLARLCVVVGLRSYECLRRAACCCYCVCEPEAARAEFLECAHSGALCGWLRPGHPPAPFNISLPPPGHFQDR